jgi:hypothetical protein
MRPPGVFTCCIAQKNNLGDRSLMMQTPVQEGTCRRWAFGQRPWQRHTVPKHVHLCIVKRNHILDAHLVERRRVVHARHVRGPAGCPPSWCTAGSAGSHLMSEEKQHRLKPFAEM